MSVEVSRPSRACFRVEAAAGWPPALRHEACFKAGGAGEFLSPNGWLLVKNPGAPEPMTQQRWLRIIPVAREERNRASVDYAHKLAETLACLGVTGDGEHA